MHPLWTIAGPVLLVDIFSPILLAAVVLTLAGERPYHTSLALIAGHTAAYLGAGLLIHFGLATAIAPLFDAYMATLRAPIAVDFAVELILGAALLLFVSRRGMPSPQPKRVRRQRNGKGLVSAFFLGITLKVAGLPFAIPYFTFLGLLAGRSDADALVALVIYNGLYAAPFLLVPAARAMFGRSVLSWLHRASAGIDRIRVKAGPILLVALGTTMVSDASLYFLSGSSLI